MITMPGVTQLMGHHVLDAGARSAHEVDVQRHIAGARKAAPAGLHGAHDQAGALDTLESGQGGVQYLAEHRSGAVKIPAVQKHFHAVWIGVTGQADDQFATRKFHAGRVFLQHLQPVLPAEVEVLFAVDVLPRRGTWAVALELRPLPLGVLAFALVSVPLARSMPRQGVYGRLGLAILVYFVFMNLQRVAERWMGNGTTPAWLGMWWVPILMVLVAGLVILTDSHWFAKRWQRLRRACT